MTDAPQQARYEVRFDFGAEGLAAIAPGAGAIVLVDALGRLSEAAPGFDPDSLDRYGTPVALAALGNRTAVARWCLAQQHAAGGRLMVAVVALGARPGGGSGFEVNDLLAAGAAIEALAAVGIDACSPEAAAATAAWSGLARATSHLFTASSAGQRLIAAGRRDEVERAAAVDVSGLVPVWDREKRRFVTAGS